MSDHPTTTQTVPLQTSSCFSAILNCLFVSQNTCIWLYYFIWKIYRVFNAYKSTHGAMYEIEIILYLVSECSIRGSTGCACVCLIRALCEGEVVLTSVILRPSSDRQGEGGTILLMAGLIRDNGGRQITGWLTMLLGIFSNNRQRFFTSGCKKRYCFSL